MTHTPAGQPATLAAPPRGPSAATGPDGQALDDLMPEALAPDALTPDDLARIVQAPGWQGGHVAVVDLAAGPVVVKGCRPARSVGSYRLRYQALNTLARVLGLPFLKAAPAHGGERGQAVEVARLRALRAPGAPVPAVLHVAPSHFVMQWLGRDHLATLLHARHPQAAALWQEAGQALVRLHAAGQYLSQGFARNIIVNTRAQPPRLGGMIDFEDDPLEVMPLPEAQLRDWLAFLHSSLWMLPLSTAEVDACLDTWLASESPAVRALFARACQRLGWLRHLPASRRLGRDTLALQVTAACAHRYAQRAARASAARASATPVPDARAPDAAQQPATPMPPAPQGRAASHQKP
ncbi:MAG: hypothetical protein Q4F13_12340 [Pseudomonadota bacterium]|nr:hypothetical protein [Pseudomonadota bacterium]